MQPKKIQQILKKWIIKIFADTHNIIVGLIFLSLIGVAGAIFAFAKNLALFLLEWLQSPMPLWSTLALICLSCLLTYRILGRNQSYLPPDKKINGIVKYFTIEKFEWRYTIFPSGKYLVDRIPLCKDHHLSLIPFDNSWECPEIKRGMGECRNAISDRELDHCYVVANSYIEREIRNMTGFKRN